MFVCLFVTSELTCHVLQAFNMIDQNNDGFICKEDLHDMLASLGKCFAAGDDYTSSRIVVY